MNRVPRKGRRCPIAIGNSECCDSKGSSSISRAVWSVKAWQCGNLDHLCLYPAYLSLFADPNRRSHAVIRGDHNMYDYFRFCPGIIHAVRSDNTFPMPQFVGFCCPTSKEHHTQAERPTKSISSHLSLSLCPWRPTWFYSLSPLLHHFEAHVLGGASYPERARIFAFPTARRTVELRRRELSCHVPHFLCWH